MARSGRAGDASQRSIDAMTAALLTPPELCLTPAQRDAFALFGYLHLPGLIRDRIDEVIEDFEHVWRTYADGQPGRAHDGRRRSCIYPFIDQHPRLSALLDDPRLHGLLVSLLGEDFVYIGSDGNFYAGDTPWHTDGRHTGPTYLKIAIYLDDLDGHSGALRVVPGSHRLGEPFAQQACAAVPDAQARLGCAPDAVPAAVLATRPGDVVVFHHNLLHGAFHGASRRRMFTLNCCAHHAPDQVRELEEYLGGHARFLIERNLGPAMLATASPARMRHLQPVLDHDFLIRERLAAERAAREEPSRG